MRGLKKTSLWLAPLLLAPVMTAFATPAAAATGTLEICKAGNVAGTFSFTVTNAPGTKTVTVANGGCSGPLAVNTGRHVITEAATAGSRVSGITVQPSSRMVAGSKNLAARRVTVTTPATGGETLVNFTNQAAMGKIKVCKQADASSPGLAGNPFTFSINGGAAFSVKAGPPGRPNCSMLYGPYQAGTNLSVAETGGTANTHVSGVTFNGTAQPASSTANVTLRGGVNILTFTNALDVVQATAQIEICKDGTDPYVQGNYTFTVSGKSGTFTTSPGYCTAPIDVPAGSVTVTETGGGVYPSTLTNVYTNPAGRVVNTNLTNRSATVNAVANDDTQVTFVNSTVFATVKVCKQLAAGSESSLQGQRFDFTATSSAGVPIAPFSITVPANSNSLCRNLPPLPATSTVTVTEAPMANVVVTPSATQTVTASGNQIRMLTFTNAALGTIEVCKKPVAGINPGNQPTFQFTVNGRAPISVQAGTCSQPIQVPVGTATVQELALANYAFVSSDATGPDGSSRVVTPGNPITVSVPWGGVENETSVSFTNRVRTGTFKICKSVVTGSGLENTSFGFTYFVDGAPGGHVSVLPGTCSGLIGPFNLLQADGTTRTGVYVTEDAVPTSYVQSITYQGSGTVIASDTKTRHIEFYLGEGVNAVTYLNARSAP